MVVEILPEVDIVCAFIIIFTICFLIINITVIIIAMIFLPTGRVVLEMLPEVDIVCNMIIIIVIILITSSSSSMLSSSLLQK